MKSFFIALILGIFIGSVVTNYFADPTAWDKLKEAKARLSGSTAEPVIEKEKEEVPSTAKEAPAMFEVGSGELNPSNPSEKPEEPAMEPEPIPLPRPEAEAEAEDSEVESPSDDTIEERPEPAEESATEPQSRTEELIEQGSKKAGEIAEIVKEKAAEAADEVKPFIETGIDITIATAIRAQYKLEQRIDSDQITISVDDKIVTLSGKVSSEEVKQMAIELAVFTQGVEGVEESLEVSP